MPTKKTETRVEDILSGEAEVYTPKPSPVPATRQLQEADNRKNQNRKELLTSPRVEVSISPMYKPYFGEKMACGLNGLFIYVPLDGMRYSIAEPYAAMVAERIRKVDDQIARSKRMADIPRNFEKNPGSLELIPR